MGILNSVRLPAIRQSYRLHLQFASYRVTIAINYEYISRESERKIIYLLLSNAFERVCECVFFVAVTETIFNIELGGVGGEEVWMVSSAYICLYIVFSTLRLQSGLYVRVLIVSLYILYVQDALVFVIFVGQ